MGQLFRSDIVQSDVHSSQTIMHSSAGQIYKGNIDVQKCRKQICFIKESRIETQG